MVTRNEPSKKLGGKETTKRKRKSVVVVKAWGHREKKSAKFTNEPGKRKEQAKK